jgi:hypothetical protein
VDTENKPNVSVWVLTYNHARFIGQSLGSILMHKTDFPCLPGKVLPVQLKNRVGRVYGVKIRSFVPKAFF